MRSTMKTDLRRRALKLRRVELDLTQMRTARAARMDINRYWRIENGEADPTDDEKKALAKVLKTTVDAIFEVPREAVA
jgi:transcriptional regulator with XRE-family HTH domain